MVISSYVVVIPQLALWLPLVLTLIGCKSLVHGPSSHLAFFSGKFISWSFPCDRDMENVPSLAEPSQLTSCWCWIGATKMTSVISHRLWRPGLCLFRNAVPSKLSKFLDCLLPASGGSNIPIFVDTETLSLFYLILDTGCFRIGI